MTYKTQTTEIADKIWNLLTYPVSTEINADGYAPRPVRQDTVEYLKELLDQLRAL